MTITSVDSTDVSTLLAGRAVTLAGWQELQWLALAVMLGMAVLLLMLGPRSQRAPA